MSTNQPSQYKYKPVKFFALAYLFTWIFWIPAIFLPENAAVALMAVGLIAPAVVSTLFVLLSKSDALKQDLKNKLTTKPSVMPVAYGLYGRMGFCVRSEDSRCVIK